jgi:indole-3-glycerol phosphate synthase
MSNILRKIRQKTIERVESYKKAMDLGSLVKLCEELNYNPLSVEVFNRKSVKPKIIAEYKKYSPSKGAISEKYTSEEVADLYFRFGATAMSILTEPHFFNGSLEDFKSVRKAFPDKLLLKKDFIVDEYQLYLALSIKADVVLLIASFLSEKELIKLHQKAKELGLNTLVEVHVKEELDLALSLSPDLLGINNRNLDTMEIDLKTGEELVGLIPKTQVVICESGIENAEQIKQAESLGFSGFLVGTSLMKTNNPGEGLHRLVERKL